MIAFTDELIAICRHFGTFEREAVCCGTVTVAQCVALQTLAVGEWDIGRLAEQTGVSQSAMTRLVDGLERRGWVERVRDAADRRRVTVVLTEDGRREAERLRGLTEQAVALVLSRIPAAKHAQLVDSLRLIRAALAETRGQLACC